MAEEAPHLIKGNYLASLPNRMQPYRDEINQKGHLS